jgi:hypothetical protein
MKLGHLRVGDNFEIINLEAFYRNLKVKHSNDSGCTISGEKLNADKAWVALGTGYVVSDGTEVRRLAKTITAPVAAVAEPSESRKELINMVMNKRGRKSAAMKAATVMKPFPSGEFSVAMVAADFGVSKPTANNLVVAALKDYSIKLVRAESHGRGRPQRFYCKVKAVADVVADVIPAEPVVVETVAAAMEVPTTTN